MVGNIESHPGRDWVFAEIMQSLTRRRNQSERTLVGVDGVDGSGKTIFADALAEFLRADGRTVERVSLDNFHQSRGIRHRRGRASPDGFWLDSYDYALFREFVIAPLSVGGTGWFRSAGHHLKSDQPVRPPARFAPPGCIVVVEGMFLNRDELHSTWDFSVFLDVPFGVTADRMARRDGTPANPAHPAMRRYVEGQKLYFAACNPAVRATLVVDNTRPETPAVTPSGEASYLRPTKTEV